jgi:hypothetical protein
VGLGKTDLWELTNFCYAAGLDFMPPDQIGHMSLNGLRRRVATHDKTQRREIIRHDNVFIHFLVPGYGLNNHYMVEC